tara:strand:+ start:3708 stop:4508 length:801 start_codon:yes stop_codon:yes gene_type:complete
MKRIDLVKVDHNVKIGDRCGSIPPNITEDSVFYEDGKIVGFFIENIEGKLKQYIEIANKEFRSKNVPKATMNRSSAVKAFNEGGMEAMKKDVQQYSTILGATAPKPHMRRPYPSISSVHNVPTAKTFIKAMLLACKEAEKVVKEIMPEQYEFQKKCIEENVPKEFRFSKLFTSSISNFNISAPFHRDAGNLIGCVNVIITKKFKAKGGDLHVPDYGATMDSSNNSMLVYPAWKNVHGVTPIETSSEDGYRNSLIFYPLKAFRKYVK